MTRNMIAATRNANPVTLLYVLLALVLGAACVAGAVALDVPQTLVACLAELVAGQTTAPMPTGRGAVVCFALQVSAVRCA